MLFHKKCWIFIFEILFSKGILTIFLSSFWGNWKASRRVAFQFLQELKKLLFKWIEKNKISEILFHLFFKQMLIYLFEEKWLFVTFSIVRCAYPTIFIPHLFLYFLFLNNKLLCLIVKMCKIVYTKRIVWLAFPGRST